MAVLACERCGRATTDEEADGRSTRTGACEHCGGTLFPAKESSAAHAAPVEETRARGVACALCPSTDPSESVPAGWEWLPDARLICPKCINTPTAQAIRMNAKLKRKGRRR